MVLCKYIISPRFRYRLYYSVAIPVHDVSMGFRRALYAVSVPYTFIEFELLFLMQYDFGPSACSGYVLWFKVCAAPLCGLEFGPSAEACESV